MDYDGTPQNFVNSYENTVRAESYSKLEFAGTYYLAFRDLPAIIKSFVTGNQALDFGCGTGRSTRFLKKLGFNVVGIDISGEMIQIAKKMNPEGEYRLIRNGDFSSFEAESFDLVLSAFTFDNIPLKDKRIALFNGLSDLLKQDGILINLVSTPEMYTYEWVSFSTKKYPENKRAKSGDVVQIITTDISDKRPCYDIFWTDQDYKEIFSKTGLRIIDTFKPLATGDESVEWVNEKDIAPWKIYVLGK